MKNANFGFDYDLNKARLEGNIFERIFHNGRLNFWMSVVNYDHKKVLDVGCNTGILLIPLLEKGINITGVDIAAKDIAIAKKSLKQRNLPEEVVSVADAEKLPFKTNSFDIVILSDVLEHVGDPERCAKEALRVVKKGGLVLATVPNEWHPVVKYPWVRKILTGRKDVDEHIDLPFSIAKLVNLFPKTKVIKKGYLGFWSEILGIFEKV